jgi:hypothetical protein
LKDSILIIISKIVDENAKMWKHVLCHNFIHDNVKEMGFNVRFDVNYANSL